MPSSATSSALARRLRDIRGTTRTKDARAPTDGGSGSPEHVEQNVAAATIDLGPAEIRAITGAATTT